MNILAPKGLLTQRFLVLFVQVTVFILLILLCLWQFNRGIEASARAKQFNDANIEQYQGKPEQLTSGRQLSLTGQLDKNRLFLLDNQVHDGQVGYRLLAPFTQVHTSQYFLLDLGFVAAPKYRDQLPSLPTLPEHSLTVSARVYQPSLNPFVREVSPQSAWPRRIQQIDLAAISEQLNQTVSPVILQLQELDGLALTPNYRPQIMGSEKHFGYSLQWMLMAIVFAWLSIKSNKTRRDANGKH